MDRHRVGPTVVPMMMPNSAAARVSILFGIRGNTVRLSHNADGLLGREVGLGTPLGGALDGKLRHLALDCAGIGAETSGRKDLCEDFADDRFV
jgi:hypothetical protein